MLLKLRRARHSLVVVASLVCVCGAELRSYREIMDVGGDEGT